jgi:hypothetical protein
MNAPITVYSLADLGVLRLRGPDARQFLQGQLSNDVTRLEQGAVLRAGLHNAQGRTLALLTLLAWSGDDLGAILPLELLAEVAATLRRYVLRARLAISDESAAQRIFGLEIAAGAPAPAGALPLSAGRALCVLPIAAGPPAGAAGGREQWRTLEIAAGVPQVYRATSGQFVAQMLNLDCIDAISFSKGCYTGQEVIARAHYRGRVKRRLQRFASAAPLTLAPGDALQLEDGRAARVIESVRHADGSSEFLAVAPLSAAADEGAEGEVANGAASPRVRVRALPLPYELPG